MKPVWLEAFLAALLHLLAFGIVVLQVMQLENLVSLCFYAALLTSVLLWAVTLCTAFTWTDWLCLAVLGLALAHITIGIAVEAQAVSPLYFKKYILFACSVLYFQSASKVRLSGAFCRILLDGTAVLAVFLTAAYCLWPVDMHLYRGAVSRYLTFGFTNPNLAGLFLCCIYMLVASRLFESGRWQRKLFHGVLAAVQFVLLLKTGSRNTLLVAVVYTAACLCFGVFGLQRTRFSRVSAALAAVFPMVFAVLYLWLVPKDWVQALLSVLGGEGKSLLSRAEIWSGALEAFWTSPVIGAYGEVMRHMEHFQMHNTHLDIIVSYGTGVFLLICVWLYRLIRGTASDGATTMDYIRTLGFACAIALGIGEAAAFSGGLCLYVFMGLFLLLRSSRTDMKENQDGAGSA